MGKNKYMFAALSGVVADIHVEVTEEPKVEDTPEEIIPEVAPLPEPEVDEEEEDDLNEEIDETEGEIKEDGEELDSLEMQMSLLTMLHDNIATHGMDRTAFAMLASSPYMKTTILAGAESFDEFNCVVSNESFIELMNSLREKTTNLAERINSNFRKFGDKLRQLLPYYETKIKEIATIDLKSMDKQKFASIKIKAFEKSKLIAILGQLDAMEKCVADIEKEIKGLLAILRSGGSLDKTVIDKKVSTIIETANRTLTKTGLEIRANTVANLSVLREWVKKDKTTLGELNITPDFVNASKPLVISCISKLRVYENFTIDISQIKKLTTEADSLSRSNTGYSSDEVRYFTRVISALFYITGDIRWNGAFDIRSALDDYFKIAKITKQCVKQ